MKFNVQIKIFTAFFFAFFIFITAFFYYLHKAEKKIALEAGEITSQGLLMSLEKTLTHSPSSKWKRIINKKKNISIIPIDHLKLSLKQKTKLRNGEVIYATGKTYQFINLVIVEQTAYKKIGDSAYALAFYFSNAEDVIFNSMQPTLVEIVKDLQTTAKNTWDKIVTKLEKCYGFPIQIYDVQSKHLPENIRHTLLNKGVAFQTNKNTSQITMIYYVFNDDILKIGPLSYLPLTPRITDIITYFILAFFTLTLFIISFISLLFVRNLKKLYQITKQFSQGNFDKTIKLSPLSVLNDIYQHILTMGKNINQLMTSQRHLSRFVAHELRTPLYTMQLALEAMEKNSHDKKSPQKHIDSLKEDINDMNQLVGYFLLYSQSTNHELTLNKQNLNIHDWLANIVRSHQAYSIAITFNADTQTSTLIVAFDPTLLKHSINNIISNALKFAKEQIVVSLHVTHHTMVINIDDDGPGIDSSEQTAIFNAFVTNKSHDDSGKHIGLGLSICKAIVELHKGTVSVMASPVLKGARFKIAISLKDKSL